MKKKIIIIIIISFLIPYLVTAEIKTPKKAEEKTAILFFDKIYYLQNNNISTEIIIDPGQSINIISINFNFPTDKLEINSIDVSTSFCELYIEEIIDNQKGNFNFACGKPYPGVNKKSTIVKINFKKKKSGIAFLKFSNVLVLANDGFGTNVLKKTENKKIFLK